MRVFLHLGYPKCFSTTIQKELYSRHPEIFYGGIGYGEGNIDFYSDDVNLFFESGLIYFRNKQYKMFENTFKHAFQDFFAAAKATNCKICGFSSEHALFNFTPQTTDIDIKLNRLKCMFGADLKIIWIIREPLSLIVSLYKEYVNMGYTHSFNYFLLWVYQYQDRNFYHDLHFNSILENVLEYFSMENVFVTQFEKYKNAEKSDLNLLFEEISKFLEILPIEVEISNRNPSLSQDEIAKRLKSNSDIKYDFGAEMLEGIEDHRRRVFFNKVLELNLTEEELFHNVLKKRKAKEKAIAIRTSQTDIFYADKEILNKITKTIDDDFSKLVGKIPDLSWDLYVNQRQTALNSLKSN